MFITRMIAEKRHYRRYAARKEQLPANYRTVLDAVERYLTHAGGLDKGDIILLLLDDLADVFEQAAANATPMDDLIGDDPVEFIEEFLRNYPQGQWINKERERLARTVRNVSREETPR